MMSFSHKTSLFSTAVSDGRAMVVLLNLTIWEGVRRQEVYGLVHLFSVLHIVY